MNRKFFWMIVAFIIVIAGWVVPPPPGLPVDGMRMVGLFLGVLLLWLTVGIDWSSFLAIGLLSLIPSVGIKGAYGASFGSPITVFLITTFLCTFVLSETPFVKRCAISFMTSHWAKKGPWWFILSYVAAILFIGSFMSPTVTFLLFLPIMEDILRMLGIEKGHSLGKMMMVLLASCSSISSGMTPIAHVFNIMAMSLYQAATGNIIGYGPYMAFAIPVGILTSLALVVLFRVGMKPDMDIFQKVDYEALEAQIPPMDKREKLCLSIFGVVVALWVVPSLLVGIMPGVMKPFLALSIAFPPIVGILLYSLVHLDGKPLLDIPSAMQKGVPWPAVLMAAASMGLIGALTQKEIGITPYMVSVIQPMLEGVAPYALLVGIALWTIYQVNLSSNIVTIVIVCSVSLPVLLNMGGALSVPAVISMVGLLGSFAFATPPSMIHIAISISTGWVDTRTTFVYGMVLAGISAVFAVLIGYPIAAALM